MVTVVILPFRQETGSERPRHFLKARTDGTTRGQRDKQRLARGGQNVKVGVCELPALKNTQRGPFPVGPTWRTPPSYCKVSGAPCLGGISISIRCVSHCYKKANSRRGPPCSGFPQHLVFLSEPPGLPAGAPPRVLGELRAG